MERYSKLEVLNNQAPAKYSEVKFGVSRSLRRSREGRDFLLSVSG